MAAITLSVAPHQQLEFSWSGGRSAGQVETTPAAESVNVTPAEHPVPAAVEEPYADWCLPSLKGLPVPQPLPGAIEAGVFGMNEDGPIVPDEDDIASLVREHAAELLNTILDIDALDDGIRRGIDPRTGRAPRTDAQRLKLQEFLEREQIRLRRAHEDALAVYADAFGDESARLLDEHVRMWAFGRIDSRPHYEPGHPWFYLPQGDGCLPVPVEEIKLNPRLIENFHEKLPRSAAKREQKLGDMLEAERVGLEADKARYQELGNRGADALSDYDRNIAYSNDEEARAGSLALVHNHIVYRLSRICWLERQLGPSPTE